MERLLIPLVVGMVVIIILLVVIRRTAPTPPGVVVATPRPTASPLLPATATPTPGPTENPVIRPEGNQPGKIIGIITTKVPFGRDSYLLTIETPNYQNFDVFVPANVPVYDKTGASVGNNYLGVGQTVQASVLPADTDFTAKSISVMSGS
jgi:hypothetical protein